MPKKTLIVTAVIEIEADKFEDVECDLDNLFWVFDLPDITEDDLPNTYTHPDYKAVFSAFESKFIDRE